MSTHYREPHGDPQGDLLARALRAEAESIIPAGDGLTRIRDRVARRRARFRWFLPSASVVTAAALAGIAFGAYSVSNDDNTLRTQQPAHSGTPTGGSTASAHPTTTPSTSKSAPPVVSETHAGHPVTPVWPFNTTADVAQWRTQYASSGASPWHLDPKETATRFVLSLGLSFQGSLQVLDKVSFGDGTADVPVSTPTPGSSARTFGTVHLVRWGVGANAPWEVTGVTAPGGRIDAPASNGQISSPLTVRYTLDGGAEEDVTVSVRDGHATLASTKRVVGGGQQVATLAFSGATTSNGYVVVADVQSASGTAVLQRLAVTPVRFAAPAVSASGSTSAQTYPAYFVAVKDHRLAVFYAKGGGFARWLTRATNYPSGPSSPQLDASHTWVYYLANPGSLMRVKVSGGTPENVMTGEFEMNAYAYAGDRDQFSVNAMTNQDNPDDPSSKHEAVNWSNEDTGLHGHFDVPGTPPQVEQAAMSADGTRFALTVRTGTAWQVRIYDAATAKSFDDATVLPCATGESCSSPSYDAAGNLYFIQASGATTWSLMQWTGAQVKHVSTWTLSAQASPETATVDITPDAEAALVGTPAGAIYRIEHGKADPLPTKAGMPTW